VSHLTGAPWRSGDAPGDDGGAARLGTRNGGRRGGWSRDGWSGADGLTWADWRPVRLVSLELTLGSDMNGLDE
jgi:hypothetical protein